MKPARRPVDPDKRMSLGADRPEILVVSSTARFRSLAKRIPQPSDTVLEIGCSSGGTTRNLIKSGARIFATDNSRTFTDQLREELEDTPRVSVHHVDGRNINELVRLVAAPNLIFIDIGGDARLDHIALQVRFCLLAYRPRLIVVRNFELAWVTSMTTLSEPPDEHVDCFPLLSESDDLTLETLLELSHSANVNNRIYAVRKLLGLEAPAAAERIAAMRHDPEARVRRTIERIDGW
ncbi:MAG: methyltransferase domain-containing protein [Spartobacteria bacterium]|nr:methyltransferase domain-containing protein [Spartobacteria bacterium]